MSPRQIAFRNLMRETVLYVPLVALYYYLVLRLFGHSLYEVSLGGPHRYALLALAVLLGQAVVLDLVARTLMRLFR